MSNSVRIASINMTEKGSTGHIMLQITELANKKELEAVSFSANLYRSGKHKKQIQNHKYFGWNFESFIHTCLGKITGYNGFFSYFGTKQLLRWLDKYDPDVIHLHNLHAFCINLPQLFRFIKKRKIKVVWTLHDCWVLTGHCPHFVGVGCDKWKTECHHCPLYKEYPKTYVDRSKELHKKKKKWISEIECLTLVTPSEWLAKVVEKSFLSGSRLEVINNGIDLNVFKPVYSPEKDLKKKKEEKIVLGVAAGWGYKKGLDIFISLSHILPSNYKIILVGTNDEIDKRLPENIISIHKTSNQNELVKIYTVSDVFVNPTREDNFPTVNIEALACGTPVITFNVGGCPESIDETCGSVVELNDICSLEREILRVCETSPYSKENCINRAKLFDKDVKFMEYVKLYKTL